MVRTQNVLLIQVFRKAHTIIDATVDKSKGNI